MSSIHITESEKRSAYLNFLVAAATANSEVDIDAAIALTNPTTREEMGPKFTDILGYNPITAFDFHDIEEIVDDMFADSSLDLAEKINPKKREKLVRRACELYESRRDEHFRNCIVDAARELFNGELSSIIGNYVLPDGELKVMKEREEDEEIQGHVAVDDDGDTIDEDEEIFDDEDDDDHDPDSILETIFEMEDGNDRITSGDDHDLDLLPDDEDEEDD